MVSGIDRMKWKLLIADQLPNYFVLWCGKPEMMENLVKIETNENGLEIIFSKGKLDEWQTGHSKLLDVVRDFWYSREMFRKHIVMDFRGASEIINSNEIYQAVRDFQMIEAKEFKDMVKDLKDVQVNLVYREQDCREQNSRKELIANFSAADFATNGTVLTKKETMGWAEAYVKNV